MSERQTSVIEFDPEAYRSVELFEDDGFGVVPSDDTVRSLDILAGIDKKGTPDGLDLKVSAGEIVCIVGPTGSGKSRLLADVECLAQGDTPSRRRVLVNGRPPDPSLRYASHRKLVAQVSQNMNFVVDLRVGDFLAMHAQCREVNAPHETVRDVIACANDLAGETFGAATSVTQLSGGQSRALMIADTALLSASPIILLDEIENAGIDRRRALDLLVSQEKIVLLSTHDPLLALMGHRRAVIRNGVVTALIASSDGERAAIAELDRIDGALAMLRHRLRRGERIDDISGIFPAAPGATC